MARAGGRPLSAALLAAYEEGVAAIEAIAARYDAADWDQHATDQWTARQMAGHVLCVSRWYHAWLDRAEAGDVSRPGTRPTSPRSPRRPDPSGSRTSRCRRARTQRACPPLARYGPPVPMVDSSELEVRERLPGWNGRFFHSEHMTFAYYEIDADAVPLHEHDHPQEEVWHIVTGVLALTIDGEELVAEAGCAAIVPAGARHSAKALNACRRSWSTRPVVMT